MFYILGVWKGQKAGLQRNLGQHLNRRSIGHKRDSKKHSHNHKQRDHEHINSNNNNRIHCIHRKKIKILHDESHKGSKSPLKKINKFCKYTVSPQEVY